MKSTTFIFVLLFLLLTSCNRTSSKHSNLTQISSYPEEIKKLKAEKFYDYAKWLFYLSNFDNTSFYCYYKDMAVKENIDPVSLDVKLAFYHLYGDTIDIELCFTKCHDTIYCFQDYNINYYNSFGTTIGSDTVLYRSYQKVVYPCVDDMFANPIKYKNEVYELKKNGYISFEEQEKRFIKYLNTTDDSICNWLRNEMNKRKISSKF